MKFIDFIKDLTSIGPDHMPPLLEAPRPEIIQTGVVKQGEYLHLVDPTMEERGIKLVSIPSDLMTRFMSVRIEWNAIQFELSKYPTSLRPRKRRSGIPNV